MIQDRDTSWSSSLVTASSFVGLLVAAVFGLLATLSGKGEALEYYTVATICAASFVSYLREA